MKKPLSYSGISMYEQCPSKFRRHYIDKEEVKNPPTPETAPAMFRGTRIHAEYEDLINGKRDDVSKEARHFQQLALMLRDRGAKAEVPFCLSNDWELQDFDSAEGLLRGIADLEVVEDGYSHGEVDDWKTGKVYDSHADQRALYALVLLIKFPHLETVQSRSIYIDQKVIKAGDYSRPMLDSYKWIWERKVNKCRPPQAYPMRPSWKCRFCDFSKKKGGKCPNG